MNADINEPNEIALTKTRLASEVALTKTRVASEISDLRWKRAKRTFLGLTAICATAGYIAVAGYTQNWWTPSSSVVAPVVRIEGAIMPGSDSGSADAIIRAIKIAFDDKKAAGGIILYIDSPGGSPAEAERINGVIEAQKKETGKKVYAVCGNLCASAGYMIAIHADEVYAGRYSLVGSIGAILSTWNFSEAIGKFGVQHHSYASGKLKSMLDPYHAVKPEDSVKAQSLVSGMGKVFAAEVETFRGAKLSKGVDLFTGEVWTGEEAKTNGLIDGVATLDDVVLTKFGKDAKASELNKPGKKFPFMQTAADALVTSLSAAVTQYTALNK